MALGRDVFSAALVALSLLGAPSAAADDGKSPADGPGPAKPPAASAAVILPTVVVEGNVRRLPSAAEPELLVLASGLDALLTDTAQDLGLSVDLTQRAAPDLATLADSDLVAQAQTLASAVFSPSLSRMGHEIELRIVMAEPGSRALRMRVERVKRDEISVRSVIMLRDLVREASRPRGARPPGPAIPEMPLDLAQPARSAGRAVLVVNSTIFGGLAGYSVQRSSGSDDPRLLYPLLAVGAGIGLGGSIIVSEEWDVGVGDAWFLAASAWWPTLAGHLIYEGRFAEYGQPNERWAFGLVAGTTGVGLGAFWLTLNPVAEGGAMVTHSGGGLGLIFGGLTELFANGDIYDTPFAGMGYGAGFGWLGAAAVASLIHVPSSRVLAVDLGAVLGGLGGAALGSPLLFDEPTPTQQRVWLGITAGSALVGGGVAIWATRDSSSGSSGAPSGTPLLGVIGESTIGSRSAPILGLGWRGSLQ